MKCAAKEPRAVAFRVARSMLVIAVLASCGGSAKTDARYPPRPEGCDVKVFRGKVAGITYDDIGHVDSICGSDLGPEACLAELKNQTCKLGGDIVYDVPDEPNQPSPDKISYTGRVAHTRTAGRGPDQPKAR
ncbi:MAG TPA: hypothetical protein VK550_07220 [Polyangiaceae bacterium]|nr:hypothetical protein [Polyangiaceae bacterium]